MIMDVFTARSNVIKAALRMLDSIVEEEPHAHSSDEAQYAEELLALAARDLVNATDQLPEREQPVGWRKVEKV